MGNRRTLLFRFVKGIIVAVHTEEQPSAEEWTQFCEMIGRRRLQTGGALVYTEGGGPSSRQRDEMRKAQRDAPQPRAAVVTDSAFARGIVTAINWFYRDKQAMAFAPDRMADALQYACGQGEELLVSEVTHTLHTLARELGVTLPEEDVLRQSQG